MKNIRFAFFGTPQFSVRVLDALEAHGYLPALVITAPDKPRGRGLKLSHSPAKAWAKERDIDTIEPATLKDESVLAELRNTDWDVFVVAAYAKLLRPDVLSIPRRKCLNVHPSLLPKFRGPSPVLSAILADERETGVTIMQMTPEMDAGPIVAQARIEIEESEWPLKGSMLEDLLATEGGNMLAEILPDWIAETITSEPQNDALATYTRKFTDEDARIDLEGNPREQFLKIRAFDKNPRAYFIESSEKRVIVTEASLAENQLHLERVIPEGKREMAYGQYLHVQSEY